MWDDAFFACDDAGNIGQWNEAAALLFGRATLDGTSIGGLFIDAEGAPLTTLPREKQALVGVRADDGARFPVEVAVAPLRSVRGPALHAIVVRSSSDGRRADAIRQMAANVGHGLRNPLGAISNAWFYLASRLRAGPVSTADARVAQFLEIVDVELKRCSSVVNDLFDYANLKPIARVPVHLEKLVDELVAALPSRGAVVINNAIGGVPLVSADAAQLAQALSALLQNAIEAVDENSGRVDVRARLDGDDVVIEVEDNGPGIPADARAHLFEPLYTTKLKGTGLGLAIVDAVARRHGGAASAGRGAHGGALFRIRIAQRSGG